MHGDDWNRYGDELDSVPHAPMGDDGMTAAEHREVLVIVGLLLAAAVVLALAL